MWEARSRLLAAACLLASPAIFSCDGGGGSETPAGSQTPTAGDEPTQTHGSSPEATATPAASTATASMAQSATPPATAIPTPPSPTPTGACSGQAMGTFYPDRDGDGFGVDAEAMIACQAPEGTVATGGDCDDDDPDRSPAAPEICDDVDDDCDGALGGMLDAEITFGEGFPTVPRFSYERPPGSGDAVLTVLDPPFTHTWTQGASDPRAGEIAFPLAPGLKTTWTLSLAVGDATCQASGALENGAYPSEKMAPLSSTMTAAQATHPDYHLIPAELKSGPQSASTFPLILIDEAGRLLWYLPIDYPVLSTQFDAAGRGVWAMNEQDYLQGTTSPPVQLDLWGWGGELLETYQVPAGHHDFDLSTDQRRLNALAYEDNPALEEACGYTIYGDYLYEYDLDTGERAPLWRSVETDFPLPTSCGPILENFSYYYANGMERVGDTFGITFSGNIQAFAIGAADGTWYTLYDDEGSDLRVVFDGEDLRSGLVRAPHSLVCTEGEDWGMGTPEDAITCVSFARQGAQNCDSADLFWVDRADLTAHYVATWPPASQVSKDPPGCATTAAHGNVNILGDPAPAGDGYTRMALYTSDSGVLDMLGVHATPSKTSVTLEYTIRPVIPLTVTGGFVTSTSSLGSPHRSSTED